MHTRPTVRTCSNQFSFGDSKLGGSGKVLGSIVSSDHWITDDNQK